LTTASAHIADDPSVQEAEHQVEAAGRKPRSTTIPAAEPRGSPSEHDLTPSVRVVTVPPVLRQLRYLTTGVLAKGAVIAMLATPIVAGGLGGCGPVEYINQVSFKAASALAAAKEAQADRYAPYEYTAAEAYLHKAREEAAYAQYQDSIEYGRKAEEQAHKARAIALSHMSRSSSEPASTSEPSKGSEPPRGSEPPKGIEPRRSEPSGGIEPPAKSSTGE
jgi:hypothetical protein